MNFNYLFVTKSLRPVYILQGIFVQTRHNLSTHYTQEASGYRIIQVLPEVMECILLSGMHIQSN